MDDTPNASLPQVFSSPALLLEGAGPAATRLHCVAFVVLAPRTVCIRTHTKEQVRKRKTDAQVIADYYRRVSPEKLDGPDGGTAFIDGLLARSVVPHQFLSSRSPLPLPLVTQATSLWC